MIHLSSIWSYIFVLSCYWLNGGLRWRLLFAFIALPEEPSFRTAARESQLNWIAVFPGRFYGCILAILLQTSWDQLASVMVRDMYLISWDKSWSWFSEYISEMASIYWGLPRTPLLGKFFNASTLTHGLKIPFCCVGTIDPLSGPWGESFVVQALISWLESPSKGEF